jgi:hypothetical protein
VKVVFVKEAQQEFLEAITHYEEARSGLGQRFKEEVVRCTIWIAEHPEVLRSRRSGCRRINLKIFPYYLPFVVREQALWVIAVAHSSRSPHYWISRRLPE